MVRNIIVRERMGSSESGTMSSLVKRVVGKRGYDDALNQFSRRINRKLETLKGNTVEQSDQSTEHQGKSAIAALEAVWEEFQ